jgi:hypothetical protein
MGQMLGAFGLLDFTMLRPVLHGVRFETYEPFISLIFQILFRAVTNRGYRIREYSGQPVFRILLQHTLFSENLKT